LAWPFSEAVVTIMMIFFKACLLNEKELTCKLNFEIAYIIQVTGLGHSKCKKNRR
jgi:hypothetical protein